MPEIEPIVRDSDIASLYASMRRSARQTPNKTALIEGAAQLTYAQLLQRVDALAQFLRREGVSGGDRVALMMLNGLDFCCAFYAVQKIGAACVMINTKWQHPEIRHALETTQATILILNARWLDKVGDILPGLAVRRLLLDALPDNDGNGLPKTALYEIFRREQTPATEEPEDPDPDAVGLIMFTSGTTGKPKGAMLSQRNLLHSILSYADLLQLQSDEVTVLPIPAFHITGLICVLGLFVHCGATVVLRPTFDPVDTLEAIARHQVTHFHAVPTVYIALTRALEHFPGDVACLRSALCGGGFITHEAIVALRKKLPRLDFRPVYGLTETSGAGVGFPCDYLAADKPGAAGKALAAADVFAVDANGNRLPPNTVGELCFRGPTVARGYYGMDELPGGVLRTGDVGKIDEDGFVYVLDRIKDVINRGGEKIFSLEVENALMEMDGVAQAQVFALPDAYYGEIVAAAIIPGDGTFLAETAGGAEKSIRSFLTGRLARYKIPEKIFFLDALPTNASNKVLKSALRERFRTTAETARA